MSLTVRECEGRLIIGGDMCPVDANVDLFSAGDIRSLLGVELCDLIERSDGLVFNLEVPLTDVEDPIRKSGPNLIAPTNAIRLIHRLSPIGVCLANNHILDQGEQGLRSTLGLLADYCIPYFGAGEDIDAAGKALTYDANGMRVCFFACAEHEFTIAANNEPGANPFDPLTTLSAISKLAEENDRVVVLYHGMKEHHRFPSPETKRRCHAMVDHGASLVLCQHSHCIGCEEGYGSAHILYGQGDFCFARGNVRDSMRTGLLVSYRPADNSVEYLPIENDGRSVWLSEADSAKLILGGFVERSDLVTDDDYIASQWEEFCETLVDEYAIAIMGAFKPRGLARLLNIFWSILRTSDGFRSGVAVGALLNALQCEAHNEALKTILKKRLRS